MGEMTSMMLKEIVKKHRWKRLWKSVAKETQKRNLIIYFKRISNSIFFPFLKEGEKSHVDRCVCYSTLWSLRKSVYQIAHYYCIAIMLPQVSKQPWGIHFLNHWEHFISWNLTCPFWVEKYSNEVTFHHLRTCKLSKDKASKGNIKKQIFVIVWILHSTLATVYGIKGEMLRKKIIILKCYCHFFVKPILVSCFLIK